MAVSTYYIDTKIFILSYYYLMPWYQRHRLLVTAYSLVHCFYYHYIITPTSSTFKLVWLPAFDEEIHLSFTYDK